ncbi:hypothetical protein Hanom_Chr16g01428221 [Helianthus anomalus]
MNRIKPQFQQSDWRDTIFLFPTRKCGLHVCELSFTIFSCLLISNYYQLTIGVHYFNSYLTKNNLTGAIPGWVLSSTKNVDVSYNHFTWDASSGPRKCDQGTM